MHANGIDVELNRSTFSELLERNDSLMVFKFGADWCGPSKILAPMVDEAYGKLQSEIRCFHVDVDKSFDLFAYLKSKKMLFGIPTIMAWKPGNTGYVPDQSVVGVKSQDIEAFFNWCEEQIKE